MNGTLKPLLPKQKLPRWELNQKLMA